MSKSGELGARARPARRDRRDQSGRVERDLRRVIDAAPFGAHVYDLSDDGRLVFAAANASADRILGVDCSQFIGMTIEEAFPQLVETPVPAAYRAVALTGEPYHDERVAYDQGAIAGVFDVYALQLAPRQMAAFFLDITERRRAETKRAELEAQLQQARKMEAIGALAGGIAHDFNNLLTAITGYADLLRASFDATDPRIEDVDQIRKAAERAASLVRQLLAFSRRELVRTAVVDVGEAVRSAGRILRRVLGEQIALSISIDPDVDSIVGDETQLVQVVLNLAVNGRDAMPSGGTLSIRVTNAVVDDGFAEAHPPLSTGRHVRLAVADTGVGMDEETRRRAFEPFFTTKAPGSGTGLGLATVYGIVTGSGGGVFVDSEPGRGSEFSVYIPSGLDRAAVARAPGDPAEPRDATPLPVPPGTILVTEDADDVAEFVARVLGARGHRVLAARDGATALALAAEHASSIDVLLTDVVMPGMGGPELAERFRLIVPDVRVVYMSGYAASTLPDQLAADPGFRFLRKPFRADELERAIEDALRESIG